MTAVWGSSPTEIGVQQARSRLERADVGLSEAAVQQGLMLAEEALHEMSATAPDPAVELFVEQVVVAVAMREVYDEPELKPVEVRAYLGIARWFFNSLWHDHP